MEFQLESGCRLGTINKMVVAWENVGRDMLF